MDDDFSFLNDDEVSSLDVDFDKAVDRVRRSTQNLDSSTLLLLYGRYKIATDGVCTTAKPSFFDFRGRQKWESWKSLGDMTPLQAKTEYIRLVDEKLNVDEQNESKNRSRSGLGQAISKFAIEDTVDDLDEFESNANHDSFFDAVKNDDVDQCKLILAENPSFINLVDKQYMTALHWAADRSSSKVARWMLVDGAADKSLVNGKDSEGQTALHYASFCDHLEIAVLLLKAGADRTAVDAEGLTPYDVAASSDMQNILKPV